MINEIDKICPEEGKPGDLANNTDPQTHDTNSNTSYE
jgi:hypothetical protein